MSSRHVLALAAVLLFGVAGLWFWLSHDSGGAAATPRGELVELASPDEDLELPQLPELAAERGGVEVETFTVPGGIPIQAGVRVRGDGVLEGRVIDRGTGKPVDGARVELFDTPPAGASFIQEITTLFQEASRYVGTGLPIATTGSDGTGAFRFEGVRSGDWYVQARGAFHVPDTVARARVVSPASGAQPLDVYVRSGGRVVGRVLRPDGEPAPGAEVALLPSISTILDSVRQGSLCFLETRTEEDGTFVLAGVPPGPGYDVYALGRGFALSYALDVAVVAGQDSELTIQGRAGGGIEGRIVSVGDVEEQGASLPGAHVACMPRGMRYLPFAPRVLLATRTVADGEGRYVLSNVPPGDVELVGIGPGHTAGLGPTVFVPEGGTVGAEDFELETGAMVRGVVVDGEGEPLSGVRVTWEPIDLRQSGFGGSVAPLVARVLKEIEFPLTGADGRFQAGAFPGEPPHEIRFEKEGYAKVEHRWDPRGAEEEELRIVLETGGFIEGIVMDAEAAEPIPAVTVQSDQLLGTKDLPFSGPLGGNLVETDRGRFRIGPFEAGEVELTLDAKGYLRTRLEDIEVAAGETVRGVIVQLFPGGTVRGRVVDPEGLPIAGAIVFPRYKEEGELELPADFDERRGKVERGGERSPRGLASYVAQLGVAGANSTLSGPDGSFELTGLEPGVQSVGAVHRDYSPGWSEGFEVPYDGAPVTTEVVLEPGGAIFGTVTDRFDRPIEGAIVVAVAPYNMDSDESTGDALYQGHTDPEGYYRIDHVAGGSYFMVVTRGDEVLDPMSFLGALNFDMVSLSEGDELEHDIIDESVGGTRLFGRVTSGGEEVGVGQITAMGFESRSLLGVDLKLSRIREGGRYEFEGLAPGEYQLTVQADGIGGQARMAIEVPDLAEVQMDLLLPEGRIAGRVLDAETGEPIPGAWISASSDSAPEPEGLFGEVFGRESGRVHERTDEGGAFSFEHLEPASYDLLVRNARKDGQHYAPGDPLPFDLDDNERIEDVEVRLFAALELTGRVTSQDGEPIEDASVTAWMEGRLDTRERASTDEQGRYTLRGLAPGTYLVTASHPDYAPRRRSDVELARGSTAELPLTLESGIQVDVLVLGEGGQPVSGASARLVRLDAGEDPTESERAFRSLFEGGGVSDAGGRLSLGAYLPGNYRLEAQRGSGRSASREVELEEGSSSTQLRIRLR